MVLQCGILCRSAKKVWSLEHWRRHFGQIYHSESSRAGIWWSRAPRASEQVTRVDRQTAEEKKLDLLWYQRQTRSVAQAVSHSLGSHFGIVFFCLQLSVRVRATYNMEIQIIQQILDESFILLFHLPVVQFVTQMKVDFTFNRFVKTN